ncbi:MAG: tRNA pseudouridine(38-40) synthase TruA [Pseudomonadota bacterium]|nr:tRNA pseudouridine(38-40) synthase TruA [Pseudomonadota bacterium]
MRIALGVEYDGAPFQGWQAQRHTTRTIQSTLERALARVAAAPVEVTAAGRTDAGVHAQGQVVHFDSPVDRPEAAWVLGGNRYLPSTIAVRWARPVPDRFHARFSARWRCYRYLIHDERARSALMAGRVTWFHYPLDVVRMAAAGKMLVGEHDFSSFRGQECQARSPIRTVHSLSVQRQGALVVLEIQANAFLHHMVRNIAGVLMAIGKGDRPVSWAGDVLAQRNRMLGGVTAAPDGLYLTAVGYPREFGFPEPVPDLCAGFPDRWDQTAEFTAG